MKRSDLTQFSVTSVRELPVHTNGNKDYEVEGIFSRLDDVSGEYWFWLLGDGREYFTPQHKSLNRETGEATLVFSKEAAPPTVRKYGHLSSYWQLFHVWMIEEPEWQWSRVTFKASDAVVYRFESDGQSYSGWRKHTGEVIGKDEKVVAGMWDHEHCELCNKSLGDGDDAFVDIEDHWLCENCYSKYRIPHSLAFVNEL